MEEKDNDKFLDLGLHPRRLTGHWRMKFGLPSWTIFLLKCLERII